MRTVRIELTGKTPLLMHSDNIDWADQLEEWQRDPANKAKSKAGDDRTPPWRWIGSLNSDDPKEGVVTIPSEYIMRAGMAGGAQVPTGKGKGTFKSLTQSGMISEDFHWSFYNNGKAVQMTEVWTVASLPTFKEQLEAVRDLGFTLFVKRAKVNNSKHIRVRPRFDKWTVRGSLIVVDDQITDKILSTIFDYAGRLKGLGDWRPGAPKSPGPFGTFSANILK